jgi:hypothetical protein
MATGPQPYIPTTIHQGKGSGYNAYQLDCAVREHRIPDTCVITVIQPKHSSCVGLAENKVTVYSIMSKLIPCLGSNGVDVL